MDGDPESRKRHSKYMQLAIRMAEKSESLFQMSAVIIRGGSVIGCAPNSKDENGHAELRALNISGDTKGATVYVARLKRDGSCGISKPCPMCWSALNNAGVKKVVFFNREGIETTRLINEFAWSDKKSPFISVGMELPMTYREIYQEQAEVA